MPDFFSYYMDKKKATARQRGGVAGSAPWLRGACLALIGLFLQLSAIAACQAQENSGEVFSAQVVRVLDGDSFEVQRRGKRFQVRLWGIDTPEWQQGYAQEAKSFSRQRIQGRKVQFTTKDWDKYGRLVALVEVDGESLSELLLREGLAWVHIYYCKEPVCEQWRQLERQARTARRGLWQEKEPVPPWKWKRGQRGHR